jgi:hypothetical protein
VIEEADGRLADWVGTVVQGAEVSFDVPAASASGRGVGLYLFEVVPEAAARNGPNPPLQASLRYLVTAWDESPQEAHTLLGNLLFAAMETPDLEVDAASIPISAWEAFGVAPRPSFVLRVPLRRERPDTTAPRVRGPLVVHAVAMVPMRGRVVGPGDVPLTGARVEVPSLNLSASTDRNGNFYFAGVPAEPSTVRLRVKARGKELALAVERPAADEPLLIRFEPLED